MHKKDWALLGITCVLSLIFMLPRILSAQFGLLDDGVLLLSAQAALKNLNLIWYQFQASGRFLPTALLFRALVFSFAGFSAELWYLWSTFQLILITLTLFFLARKWQASRLETILCILIFLASPSTVENFYTLSKAEIPLLLLITAAILCAAYYSSFSRTSAKILIIGGTFVFLLLGFGAKETAIVLPFMFLGWFIISWLFLKRNAEYHEILKRDLILLISSLVSGVAYWSLRYLLGLSSLTSAGYTGGYELFNFEKLIINFSTLLGWIVRDFPYLIPVLLGILFIKPLRKANILAFNLKWILWLVVWGGILLPWYVIAYYMLPFLFGAALLSGMTIGRLVHLLWPKSTMDSNEPSPRAMQSVEGLSKVALVLLIVLGSLLVVPPLVNASAYVMEQLSIDRANGRFIKKMANLPLNSRLIIDMPERLEYFQEIKIMIHQIYHRNDITIEAYNPPIEFAGQRDTYIASLIFENQILPGVRSNHGQTLLAWKTCLEHEAIASHKVFSAKIIRPVIDIGLHKILPLKMDILLGSERDIIVSTIFTYGWDVIQFVPTKANAERPGVYQDGIFILQTVAGNIRSINFGHGEEIPLTGDIDGDGYSDLVLYDEKENTWKVDLDLDGKEDQGFTINNMKPGDIPLLGDWNGDGKDTPGFFRSDDSYWYLSNSLSGDDAKKFQFGLPMDIPLVGDWDGNGTEDSGIYRPETGNAFVITDPTQQWLGTEINGISGATPVVGFWDATNRSQLALVKDYSWTMYIPIFGCVLPNPNKEVQFDYTGIPLAGIWKDQ